ncbi:MAG: LemA family protein [Sedimentisphaerales bacterium]|nr:LemA family protein [Sedimentisphaerales bacterium]MBN2842600.1 LemA family protein [Sedimentisphaerales bacterium]
MAIYLGIIAFILIIFIAVYNSLIGKKNMVENAYSSIDVMLKKRFDLIPNLVATVKGYMVHENETLTKVTEMRAKAMSGTLTSDQAVELDNMLGRIMVSVEKYPDLKASSNFLQLQGSLNEIEEQLSASRRAFNAAVLDYNNAIEMFPSNLVANMINYKTRQMFEIASTERNNPDVGNLFRN